MLIIGSRMKYCDDCAIKAMSRAKQKPHFYTPHKQERKCEQTHETRLYGPKISVVQIVAIQTPVAKTNTEDRRLSC